MTMMVKMDDARTSKPKQKTGIFETSKSYQGRDSAGDTLSIFRGKDMLKKKKPKKSSKKAKKKKHG
jgi:hypothetical protein